MVRHVRLYSLSSMAFIGLPWPTNKVGMRGVAFSSENAVFSEVMRIFHCYR